MIIISIHVIVGSSNEEVDHEDDEDGSFLVDVVALLSSSLAVAVALAVVASPRRSAMIQGLTCGNLPTSETDGGWVIAVEVGRVVTAWTKVRRQIAADR